MSTSSDPTADRLARAVLTHRLHVKPKENVTIEAYPAALRWATGFVREARRMGARPILLYEDEASYWDAVENGRASLIGDPGAHEWGAVEKSDVYIYFWGPADLARRDKLSNAVQEELTAFNPHWYEVARKAGVRGARMAIARATPENARQFGVNFRTWEKEMIASSIRDPASMARDAERIRRAFARGRSVRITHPNGTDLKLGLAQRRVTVALGDVTPASQKTAFGMMANVPDASVYTAIDEETADGVFVANRATTRSSESLKGGRWKFKDGRLRAYSFSAGGRSFAAEYRAAGSGKDRPAFLEVGLDPDVRNGPTIEEAERGAVTLGVGRNVGFGGKTKSDFFGYITLGEATVSVDGRPLLRRGRVVGG